jgi:AraC family transcriptional regulator
MGEAISPEQLPRWVPGKLTLDSKPLGWRGMRLRGYRYAALDVEVPEMSDYMIVVYGRGATPMARRCEARWSREIVAPGVVSLLTHCTRSHWRWADPIDVTHFYLSPRHLAGVAESVFDRDVDKVELDDVLRADDPVLANMVWSLSREAAGPGLGGQMYAESLLNQACVHILRNYANVRYREPAAGGGLCRAQMRRLEAFVQERLSENITLEAMADMSGLSVYCFARKFRRSFGQPPHQYVMRKRLELACQLVRAGRLPLKKIAYRCGFTDQSHMTRVFQRSVGCTPGRYRQELAS